MSAALVVFLRHGAFRILTANIVGKGEATP